MTRLRSHSRQVPEWRPWGPGSSLYSSPNSMGEFDGRNPKLASPLLVSAESLLSFRVYA